MQDILQINNTGPKTSLVNRMTFEDTDAKFVKSNLNVKCKEEQEQEQPRIYSVTDGIKSPHSKKTYRLTFNQFLRSSMTTTVVTKNQQQQNLRTLLDYKPNVIESKIIDYIEHLKERKLSYSAIQVSCSAIFHFFDINDVNLNKRKIWRFFPQDESNYYSMDRPYSVNEIEHILANCDIRSRVIILLMTSTGMRIGGLRELSLCDIKKIDEFSLYMIWVYNRSKADRYYTFSTPECAAAIDAYLDYRKSFGEELKDKSPLIREQFNIDNPFTANAPKFLSPRMMFRIIEDVLKRSGVNQVKVGNDRRDVMTSHGFRKFFINQCNKASLGYTTWKHLAGHKLAHTDASYIRTTEEDILAEYIKAIPLLTIDPNQRLKKENEELKKDYLAELGDLRQEFNEMKQLLVHLSKESQKQLVDEFYQKVEDKADIEWSCD